jgi:hypothetical protein
VFNKNLSAAAKVRGTSELRKAAFMGANAANGTDESQLEPV